MTNTRPLPGQKGVTNMNDEERLQAQMWSVWNDDDDPGPGDDDDLPGNPGGGPRDP